MKRSVAALGAGTILLALCGTPAHADPAGLGLSYTAAARISPGAGLNLTTTTSGDVSDLFDFLSPVLDQVVAPLSNSLSGLSASMTASLAAGITGSDYVASSPSTAQSPPSSGFPDCGTFASGSCYGPVGPTVDAPVLKLSSGTLQGYATADTTGAYAAARTTHPSLSVLGIPIGDLGVANSSTKCGADLKCASTATVADVSLLGGAVAVRTADDGTLLASVNNSSFAAVSSYTTPISVSANGVTATVQAAGARLRLGISLTLDQLLAGLGMTDTLANLNSYDAGSTITLGIVLGTGTTASSTLSKGWGLEIGIGLSAHVAISVFGLMTAEVSAQDPSATGNLADIELAYTAAADPDGTNPGGAPPSLT